MNKTIIYLVITFLFLVLILTWKSAVSWSLTINEQKDIDKLILNEINFPKIDIDKNKIDKLGNQKNIKILK